MITGELKNKIDSLWDTFAAGGISNPLDVIEQITYLMFIHDLDVADNTRAKESAMLGLPYDSIFPEKVEIGGREIEGEQLKWSVFHDIDARRMYSVMQEMVFPFIKNLHSDKNSAYSRYMDDAIFKIPTPLLLSKVVDALDGIFDLMEKQQKTDADISGDVYEYLLSKIASSGLNGQFRTPRHIIKMMVELMQPTATDVICDPACGTAGFLVATGEWLKENRKQEVFFNHMNRDHYMNHMFFGFDMDRTMLRIGAMNMMKHGIENPFIDYRDSLSDQNSDKNKYSLILANPPFKGSLDADIVAGELLKSYTTDANGKFTTDYFVCGEGYTVKEITPSKGYLLDETVYTLDVDADNYTIEKNTESLAVTEQVIKGTVQLTKVDKDFPENKLTGAEFEVYVDTNNDKKLDANDTLLGKLTEAERGIYNMSGLVYGGYFVKETVAPKSFILDSNAYYFEITENGKTVIVENEAGKGFVNVSQSGSLKIVKTSSDGKVEGFSFRVTSENGYDETFTTDKNGEIFIEDIRLGTYTISEIANGASSNYIMPAAKTATVVQDSVTKVEMHNVLRETPKTGDTRMPGLWIGIATISTLGAATFFYLSSKKRRNER